MVIPVVANDVLRDPPGHEVAHFVLPVPPAPAVHDETPLNPRPFDEVPETERHLKEQLIVGEKDLRRHVGALVPEVLSFSQQVVQHPAPLLVAPKTREDSAVDQECSTPMIQILSHVDNRAHGTIKYILCKVEVVHRKW